MRYAWGVGLLLSLSACPSSDPSSGAALGAAGQGASTTSAANRDCSLVSPSDLEAALGVTGLMSPTRLVNENVIVCDYGRVKLRLQTHTSQSDFETGKADFAENLAPPQDVSGLGDGAYSAVSMVLDEEVSSLVFLSHGTEVEIVAPASLEQVEAFAQTLIPKLPG